MTQREVWETLASLEVGEDVEGPLYLGTPQSFARFHSDSGWQRQHTWAERLSRSPGLERGAEGLDLLCALTTGLEAKI